MVQKYLRLLSSTSKQELMEQQAQPAFDYYQDGAEIPETPIFNIQAGANGEWVAEPDPSMSFHPSQDPNSAYMAADYTVDYSVHEEQVDENYDPTEFFTGIGGGLMGGDQHTNGAGNGQGGDHLQDDLAVSDDSEDEKADGDDDPMAF